MNFDCWTRSCWMAHTNSQAHLKSTIHEVSQFFVYLLSVSVCNRIAKAICSKVVFVVGQNANGLLGSKCWFIVYKCVFYFYNHFPLFCLSFYSNVYFTKTILFSFHDFLPLRLVFSIQWQSVKQVKSIRNSSFMIF